jgi:AcrR family transcriptional regulator
MHGTKAAENSTVRTRPGKVRGPSPAKTAATRRALAEAGLSAFLKNGFSGTRMSDVAACAGVAKGTAYLHFADKASLFAEVVREFVRGAAGGNRVGRPRLGEATSAFLHRTFVPILRDLQAGDRFRVLFLVITEGGRFPELAAAYREEAIDPILRLIRMYVARAKRRGELRNDVLISQPILLASPVVLAVVWNKLFAREGAVDIASLLEAQIDLLFR